MLVRPMLKFTLILTIFLHSFLLAAEKNEMPAPVNNVDKSTSTPLCESTLENAKKLLALEKHLKTKVIGQDQLLRNLLITLLIKGNVLLEGPSGLAKTTSVKALASSFRDASFQRISFRADLLPGEITGVERETSDGKMEFNPGPIFAIFVLADEVNRGFPKTQSALLEAMEERQVTYGNTTHQLPNEHFVIATQNPLDNEGTNPLPEAQLDRFHLKIRIDYPDEESELAVYRMSQRNGNSQQTSNFAPLPISSLEDARKEMDTVKIPETIEKYALKIVRATRNIGELLPHMVEWIKSGSSPRGTIALLNAAQANAYLEGRNEVTYDDVNALALETLAHRIELTPLSIAQDRTAEMVINEIIKALSSSITTEESF